MQLYPIKIKLKLNKKSKLNISLRITLVFTNLEKYQVGV